MDSMDQERERGITILAKNAAVRYGEVKINIVDTPGPRRLRRRGRARAHDGRRRDAAGRRLRGPAARRRASCSARRSRRRLPLVLVVNKVDRPDARIGEVVDEVYELFLDLDADEEQIEFPIVYTTAKAGWASTEEGVEGSDLRPLFDLLVERIPAPEYDEAPAAGAGDEPRRLPLRRPARALPRAPRHDPARASRSPGAVATAASSALRVSELYVTEGLERVAADEAGPGEIIALAGHPGDHDRRDDRRPRRPAALPVLAVDEPALGDDDRRQHLAAGGPVGREAHRAPARRPPRAGAGRATSRSASLDTERRDTWEVQGRGELQLAVLVETMRREGFELTVGKPQAMTREIDGEAPRADRAALDRRPRGLHGRGDPAARAAQGPDGGHGQPRHRLGAARLPRPRRAG